VQLGRPLVAVVVVLLTREVREGIHPRHQQVPIARSLSQPQGSSPSTLLAEAHTCTSSPTRRPSSALSTAGARRRPPFRRPFGSPDVTVSSPSEPAWSCKRTREPIRTV